MIYIGIDNGVTGTIAAVTETGKAIFFDKTPVLKSQDYTKKIKNISRVDFFGLYEVFDKLPVSVDWYRAIIERPMVNPRRFAATISAVRALESTLIFLESKFIPVQYIDSKNWQRTLLPSGASGSELKKLSADIGCRLFPEFSDEIRSHGDADSLLIAEYARKNSL